MLADTRSSEEPIIASRGVSEDISDTSRRSQDNIDKKVDVSTNVVDPGTSLDSELDSDSPAPHQTYRMYKQRFVGLVALVGPYSLACGFRRCRLNSFDQQVILNAVAAMPNPWFGPIANNSSCTVFAMPPSSLTQFTRRFSLRPVRVFAGQDQLVRKCRQPRLPSVVRRCTFCLHEVRSAHHCTCRGLCV